MCVLVADSVLFDMYKSLDNVRLLWLSATEKTKTNEQMAKQLNFYQMQILYNLRDEIEREKK